MKNVLKLSLAALSIAALAACGDSGSADAADAYVGTWKSVCYKGTGNDGNTYYYFNNVTVSKVTAAEVSLAGTGTSHSDVSCSNKLSTFGRDTIKINLGAKTTFLGANSDSIVYTNIRTGEALPGYATTSGNSMYLRTYTPGTTPTGWGVASPYTKQ